jgi:heat shock protein HslJ
MRRFVGFALGCLVMMAPPAYAQGSALSGSEWRPIQIGKLTVPLEGGLFVQFRGEGKIAGHGGCNRFFGSYKTAGRTIVIGSLGSTRMACPQGVMNLEAAFLAVLETASIHRRDGTRLVLRNAQDQELATLVQTDWD